MYSCRCQLVGLPPPSCSGAPVPMVTPCGTTPAQNKTARRAKVATERSGRGGEPQQESSKGCYVYAALTGNLEAIQRALSSGKKIAIALRAGLPKGNVVEG